MEYINFYFIEKLHTKKKPQKNYINEKKGGGEVSFSTYKHVEHQDHEPTLLQDSFLFLFF